MRDKLGHVITLTRGVKWLHVRDKLGEVRTLTRLLMYEHAPAKRGLCIEMQTDNGTKMRGMEDAKTRRASSIFARRFKPQQEEKRGRDPRGWIEFFRSDIRKRSTTFFNGCMIVFSVKDFPQQRRICTRSMTLNGREDHQKDAGMYARKNISLLLKIIAGSRKSFH